jgi:hypothetical protein
MVAAQPQQTMMAMPTAYGAYEQQPATGGSFVATGQQVLPASQGSFLAIPVTQTQQVQPQYTQQQTVQPAQQTTTQAATTISPAVTVTKRKAKKAKKKGCC